MDARSMLDPDLLETLKQRWEDNGASIVEALRPGLPDNEIDACTQEMGLSLPDEARLWWRWHDGVPPGAGDARWMGVCEYLQLAEAVRLHRYWSDLARDMAEVAMTPEQADASYWWDPNWFPITQTVSGAALVCDCSVERQAPTPIRLIDWEFPEAFATPVVASFGELVAGWIEQLDVGAWSFDQERGQWDYREDRLPPARRNSRNV
jgi:cell wall assembly regulator SMI1